MEKKTLTISSIVIATIIIIGIIAAVLLIPLITPVLTVKGTGVTETTQYSLMDLRSAKYEQVTNVEFDWLNRVGTTGTSTYSGVVLSSFLENSGILPSDTSGLEVTIIAADGFSRSLSYDEIKEAGSQIILAYGGADFDPEKDGPLRLIVSQAFFGEDQANTPYWVGNIVEIEIA